jgi:hypothetical protein
VRAPERQYKLRRSVRRSHLYHYARGLGCEPGVAREMSCAAWRLLAAFPDHAFPQHIRDYAKMGKKPAGPC